ncbi:M23 family metallopeptidase [Streptomyces clavuligerus]|uniref:Putative secreted peptidase n=1 Tax=Streptomyces clavuligerus TaxID=1901 RepID=B5GT52_STRCL|nr:M23 family metallopeptidase [Streptomyces clavuligerus]ANW19090.1 peptidase M23 [Streptomyces clavuligerus]AXU13672.1 M23 family peptidase [Streptomyces clavuligerus]EDY49498.1 secreted peptidase [Streptomyces clavuligerus]EFG08173.1 putative secreted peptidase [Streptomyces clavuligerus]MBY6303643.1 M23 family metallopeptidase [Streptomyces clavuligerus]
MEERAAATPRTGRKALMVLYRTTGRLFAVLIVCDLLTGLPVPWWTVVAAGTAMFGSGLVATRRAAREHAAAERPAAVETGPPVLGRWSATNSPADTVPSHGTHVYGQTYAIDLTAEPEPERGPAEGAEGGSTRPGFSPLWPLVRRNSAFPAFGEPLYAVADATVVHASDRQRDHLSRTSLPMLAYLMLLEAPARDIGGPGLIVGNHVVLDLGDGTYALYAHLRRGSLLVKEGDRVRAGQPLARVGNSGNSTEPHVHFHLMDGTDLDTARGVPFRWRGVGVPAAKEFFTVDESLLTRDGG